MSKTDGASLPSSSSRLHAERLHEWIYSPPTGWERWKSVCWSAAWMGLARWTPAWMNSWRVILLRWFGAKVASGVFVHSTTLIRYPWRLTIGKDSSIQHRVIIDCMGEVHIGRGVLVSQYTHLCAGTHEYTNARMPIQPSPIRVEDDVWLAADVFVGPDVTIGSNTIVGARASVFRDLPGNSVAVGDNAEVIRQRTPQDHSLKESLAQSASMPSTDEQVSNR